MNLKDILHGIIERTPFANEAERASFHDAIDNLDSATGEESPQVATATDTGNGTDTTSGTQDVPAGTSPQAETPATSIAPAVETSAAVSVEPTPTASVEGNPTEPETPSESSGESGDGSNAASSSGTGA